MCRCGELGGRGIATAAVLSLAQDLKVHQERVSTLRAQIHATLAGCHAKLQETDSNARLRCAGLHLSWFYFNSRH
jgi:hypothetical protein